MFYVIVTARVILRAQTNFDVCSPTQECIWTCSVLGDSMCEMKRVTELGQQWIKTWDHSSCASTLDEPITNWESTSRRIMLMRGKTRLMKVRLV